MQFIAASPEASPPHHRIMSDSFRSLDLQIAPALVSLQDLESSLNEQQQPSAELAAQLIHAARWTLENAPTLDKAKGVRDTLQRMRLFFQQRKATLYAANLLAAECIRVTHSIGVDLLALPRESGGRPSADTNVSQRGNSFLATLPELGIEKSTAYRWQDLAKIALQDLELYFEEMAEKDEITLAGVLNYFTSHVVIDPRADNDDDVPEMPDEDAPDVPHVRTQVVLIVCKHCGVKDEYAVDV